MSDEQQEVQLPLIDGLIDEFKMVKEKFGGDFDAAVAAAEAHLGRMRVARQIAGVKTEKKPRRASRKKKGQQQETSSEGE